MQSGDNPVKVEIVYKQDRCIHKKSVWATCRLCSESCPNDAISTPEIQGIPCFDRSKCFHCGACLASCPHEAFVAGNFSGQKIVERVAAHESLTLRCFVPYGEIDSLSSGEHSYKLGTCLAALTPGILFEIAFDKHCTIATERCETCTLYRSAGASLARNMRIAKNLLGDWYLSDNLVESIPLYLTNYSQGTDTPMPMTLCSESGSSHTLPIAHERNHEAGAQKPARFDANTNVRRLFYRQSRRKQPPVLSKDNLPTKTIMQHSITWRHTLQEFWKAAPPGQTTGACYQWPVHTVNRQACLLCGTCICFCPTGAIRHSFIDGIYRCFFTPGLCVECGLCIDSCLQHAITRGHQAEAAPFDEIACSSGKATECIRCGNPVPENSPTKGYCRQCTIELRIATEQ